MTSASISTTEIPGDTELVEQTKQNNQDNENEPGCLSEHNVVDKPSMITWGIMNHGSLIVIPTCIIVSPKSKPPQDVKKTKG